MVYRNTTGGLSFRNHTTQTVGWMPEPETRGTLRLLVSCIVTLTLCVYTAVHLNVPQKGASKTRLFLIKALWVFMGMFAPELVAYTAWAQLMVARKLVNDVNIIFQEQIPSSAQPRKHSWEIEHGFYAGMGGFIFDTSNGEEYIPGSPPLTIMDEGIPVLARTGFIPDLSKESITDKSKADSLAKGLVCIQAGWLIVECIGRLTCHLPITFLEINTLAHVLCALAMYGFWWRKPCQVRDPTPISPNSLLSDSTLSSDSLCAIMFMLSEVSKQIYPPSMLREYREMYFLRYYSDASSLSNPNEAANRPYTTVNRSPPQSNNRIEILQPQSLPPPYLSLHNGETLAGLGANLDRMSIRMTLKEYKTKYKNEPTVGPIPQGTSKSTVEVILPTTIQLDEVGVARWKLASEALQKYPFDSYNQWKYNNRQKYRPQYLVGARSPNWPHFTIDRISWSFFAVGLATAAYGGLHTVAWNDYFPTPLERLLWKISVLLIVGSGLVWGTIFQGDSLKICQNASQEMFDSIPFLRKELALPLVGTTTVMQGIVSLTEGVSFVAYAFARIFLVVESFISLRDLPIDAYKSPTWSQYISHF